MNDRPRTRVIVDIEPGGSTVCGQITVCDSGPHEFFGWLELIDGIERATRRGGAGDPVPGEDPESLDAAH